MSLFNGYRDGNEILIKFIIKILYRKKKSTLENDYFDIPLIK